MCITQTQTFCRGCIFPVLTLLLQEQYQLQQQFITAWGLTPSQSGNRWGVVPFIDTSGVLEAGKFIDFHTSDTTTSDNNGRIECDGTNFKFSKNLLPVSGEDLGSSSARWSNLYVNDLKLSNKGKQNDVDGTWGDYTIQEGETSLFLINNRNGKKYKFNLTEVEM